MAKSLDQILGWESLTGLVQETTDGLPSVLPPGFEASAQKVVGDSGTYTVVKGNRKTARLAAYGSPAVRRGLAGVSDRPVKLMHTFEEYMIPPLVFQKLRNYSDYTMQKQGQDEMARQAAFFKQYFDNLRRTTILMTLANATLYFDAKGNLLPNSSGADTSKTVTFDFNSYNQGALTFNGTSIVTASWASVTTDIPWQLRQLRKRARRLTGYVPKYAFYGENVPSYMTQNNYVKDYLARNPRMNDAFLSGEGGDIPDGLFGFTWVPVFESFFEDINGTNQDIFSADACVFTPAPSADWWDVVEGSYQVPTTLNILAGPEDLMNAFKMVYGKFGYGQLSANPPGAVGYFGDTFLPVIKVPDAVFQMKVTV